MNTDETAEKAWLRIVRMVRIRIGGKRVTTKDTKFTKGEEEGVGGGICGCARWARWVGTASYGFYEWYGFGFQEKA